MNTNFETASRSNRSLILWLAVLVLAISTVGEARAQKFPHDIYDPLGIPPIEGANVLHVEKTAVENSRFVVFDATPQQVVAWMKELEREGMIFPLRFSEAREQISRGKSYKGGSEINCYFPEGSEGDDRSLYLWIFTNFVHEFTLSGGRTIPGSTVAIELLSMYRSAPQLEYEHGVLSDLGITDESEFIPARTHKFEASIFRSDGSFGQDIHAGTPLGGSLEAKFTYGYVPTVKDAETWANGLRKASKSHAQSFEDMGSSIEGSTAIYWWTYMYHNVTYLCRVEAELDHLGKFSFLIQRIGQEQE